MSFCGGFDKMSRVLNDMGRKYGNASWLEASDRFEEGAAIIAEITSITVVYLIGGSDKTEELSRLFTKVLEIMTNGFILSGR